MVLRSIYRKLKCIALTSRNWVRAGKTLAIGDVDSHQSDLPHQHPKYENQERARIIGAGSRACAITVD